MELNNTTNALLTAIEARIKSVLDEVEAMRESLAHDAGTMPSVVSHLMIVRDSLEKLIPRLEDLPKEAVAEAIAPGVSVTIERIGFALTKLQREVEEATGRAQSGVEQLTAAGVAAITDAKSAADKSNEQLAEAQKTLRGLIDRASQNGSASASIARAATSATQQVEAATKTAIEALTAAEPRSNHRLTAIVAVTGMAAILAVGYWMRPATVHLAITRRDAALVRWASSPGGRAAYALAKINSSSGGIELFTQCEGAGWEVRTSHGYPICVAALGKNGTPGAWYLPEKK